MGGWSKQTIPGLEMVSFVRIYWDGELEGGMVE
jgi:hypothetical protein